MKNVLVLSYYFPPMGMGGVQRTAKFIKYLPDYDWKPVVITDIPGSYFAWDDELLKELTDKGTVIKRTGNALDSEKKSFKFKDESTRKFVSRAAQTFLIPDTKRLWLKKALKLADKILTEDKFDIIYSTAPPYTDFLAGAELKKKYNVPLVLDYRDSWVDCPNNYYPTILHKKFNIKLESGVLSCADSVVTINSRIKELILERYSSVIDEDKIHIIPQGYDSSDFSVSDNDVQSDKMRITYSGSFLYYYTPEFFLKGYKLACEKNKDMYDDTEACFVGTFPEKYQTLIEELGLKPNVMLVGYVDHKLCTKYLLSSSVLWMMINRSDISDMHSTGKLYEYFGTKKPVLACVPEGVARQSLKEHGAAFITEPDDAVAISEKLLGLYELYKAKKLPVPDEDYLKNYDRKNLTGHLAEILNTLIKK